MEEIVISIFLIASIIFGIFLLENEHQKNIEIIKNTKDYVIYENCYEYNNIYYCYEEVEK